MTEEPVSKQVVKQRVRNRIIEYFELAASAAYQLEYERKAPIHVPTEMINSWEDWVDANNWAWYVEPIFSPDEASAIRSFHAVWLSVADETPDPMPDTVAELIETPVWHRFMMAAAEAYRVFSIRGRFDEETEQEF